MKESRKIEFKENITNSFLKTVSAYSNYEGGTIVFGIDDEGNIIGIDGSLEDVCLDLENRINHMVSPSIRCNLGMFRKTYWRRKK